MPGDHWDKVGALLEEVREAGPERREAVLHERCDDPAVRKEVRSLLGHSEEADGFFERLESALPPEFRDSTLESQAEKPTPDPLDLEGSRVGRYEIDNHLGGGGMGIVYRAHDPHLGRVVALKFLPPFLARSSEARERFVREARTASALEHPHIATIYEIGEMEEGSCPFIVMAYYEGETLKEKLAREGPLPIGEAIRYAEQVAEALSAAHEASVIHRDVKPANVMVTGEGTVKLVDFGLATAAAETSLTETGRRLGTPAYMSPEQARGETVGPEADLWALGALLYEMLAGERPFQGERPSAAIYSALHEDPVPLSEHRAEVSRELEQVVDRCLQKAPEDRYDTAEALLEDLRALTPGEVPSARPDWTSRALPVGGSWPGWIVGVGVVAAFALSVAVGWALWGGGLPAGVLSFSEDSRLDPDRVAVFPFTVGGGEELSHLGPGMVELLGRSIDGAGDLRAVDANTLLGQLDDAHSGELRPEDARQIAADLGAGRYVLGRVLRLGERVRLSGTWYRTDGSEIGSGQVTGESTNSIQSMVDTLARAAIVDLTTEAVGRRRRLAAQTTSSAEALKAYLEGQAAFRDFDFKAAIGAFSKAIEEDSTFALAHYRMSLAVGWAGDLQRAHRHARRAAELSTGLPERDRRLLRANKAFYFGDPERAERLYRAVLRTHPDDARAHYMLGETLFHFNGSQGRPVMEARGPLRTAMELDPTFTEPLLHLVTLAALERDTMRIDSLTSQIEERSFPPAIETAYQAVRAYMLSGGPDPNLRKRLQEGGPVAPMLAMLNLWAAEDLEAASDLVSPLTSPERPEEMRAGMLTRQAELFAAQGRIQAARQNIQAVAALDSAAYWMARSRLAALPFLPDDATGERQEVREGLFDWNAETVPERLLPPRFLLPRELYPAGRLYRMGLLRAQAGRAEGALRAARRLERMDGTILTPSGPADFARSIRAEVERRRDRPEKALAHLEARENRVGQAPVFFSLHSGARERFLRAEILAQEGRLEEALRWYRTLNGIAWGDLPYLAPAHLGRARVLQRLGRDEEAAQAYRQGLRLWSEADPELQPRAKKAQGRLDALNRMKTAE